MGNQNNKPIIGNVVGSEDHLKELQNLFKSCSIVEENIQIQEKMEMWKDVAINVCLVGECGVGKSCFINNMAGEKLAEIGVVETTKDATSYPHPNNGKVMFWDFPGYGCDLYPTINDYINSIDMNRFDIILFMHKERFKRNDAELMKEIKKVGKPFFIVRSNFDRDIQGIIKMENAKIIVRNTLRSFEIPDNDKCYFICNLSKDFDYKDLMEDIFTVLDELVQGFQRRFEKLVPEETVVGQSDYLKEMKDIIAKYNIQEAMSKIREKLDAWKLVHVNVCILGESGVGKSTFINNMVGKELARGDICETTQKQKPYPHPANEKLVFWDLPGFGCRIYPTIKSYIQAMDMKRFDIILFLYKSRFKRDDAELAKEIKGTGKPFFIIRSKFDTDIQDGNVKEVENIIQCDLNKHMTNDNLKCYFISNLSRKHDYEDLMKDIFTALDNSTKEQVLAFSVESSSKAVISIKKIQLKKRIWVASTVAAGFGAIPVPGVDVFINTGLLLEEIHFMAKVLGISEVVKNRKDIAVFKRCASYLTMTGLTTLVVKMAAAYGADEIFKFILPGIGSIISSWISFVVTKYTLEKVLVDLLEAAELKWKMQNEISEMENNKIGDF